MLAYIYMIITENFERFCYFNFETSFLKNENIFRKTWVPFSMAMKNATFPYKAALSKVNVKANRKCGRGVQNGPITKSKVFALFPFS